MSSTATQQRPPPAIHPDTRVGTVRLTVSDLARSRDFYERAIGFSASERGDGALALGPEGGRELVVLSGDASAPELDPRATGLFHFAILVPSRFDLALALRRLAEAGWPLDGASDHLVSEALYLADPDGNGIEIYRDRPREQWPRNEGELAMATLPLDLKNVVEELGASDRSQPLVPPGTTIGHVHLQVAELRDIEDFYSGVLGFDVVVRRYPGALFVSAGGYHHHVGLNTWHSAGGSPPAPGAVGLRSFEVVLPSAADVEPVLERVARAGIEIEHIPDGSLVRDPSGNAVLLRAA